MHRHYQGDIARLALRFDIRLAPTMRARARPAPFLPWTGAPHADVAPPAGAAAHLALVQRIVARERRVESSTTMRDVLRDAVARQPERAGAPPASPPPSARARPAEMAVHRLRAPTPEAARTAPPAAPGREADERVVRPILVRPAAIDATAALSATELGRVTDHVVRAIDRRFVAQRERRGRI